MSYTLWVFKGPVPDSEEAFVERLERFNEGERDVFEVSPDLPRFCNELLRRHPALEGLADHEIDDSVWAMTPDCDDRLITLDMSWPAAERMAGEVPKLARRFRLAICDPQSGTIVAP